MPAPASVTALRRWLVFVALLRLLSVYLGYFLPSRLQTNLFDLRPDLVTDLYGRTFAVWTAVTCALCLACARDPRVAPVYGATLFSFVVALAFFVGEAFIFRTMSLRSAAQPGIIATVSAAWMAAGWNYYVRRGDGGGPTGTLGTVGPAASEEIEESVSKFD